jgi:hypothetical protein
MLIRSVLASNDPDGKKIETGLGDRAGPVSAGGPARQGFLAK